MDNARPDLDALEALLAKATPGPWECDDKQAGDAYRYILGRASLIARIPAFAGGEDDAALIVAAVNALPELIARIRELERERDRYHDALLSRHGGEPLALLDELDTARAEIRTAALAMRERCAQRAESAQANGADCAAAIRALEAAQAEQTSGSTEGRAAIGMEPAKAMPERGAMASPTAGIKPGPLDHQSAAGTNCAAECAARASESSVRGPAADPIADLCARLRVLDNRGGLGYHAHAYIAEAADALERLARERDVLSDTLADTRLRAERAEAERDRYKAALCQYPEGRDVMLGGALAEIESLAAKNAKWEELHRVIAEELGSNQEAWPDHGNAPLAIAATFMLHKQAAERAEAERDGLLAIVRAADAAIASCTALSGDRKLWEAYDRARAAWKGNV